MIIRKAQMKVLEDSAVRSFEQWLIEHSCEFAPQLCEEAGRVNVAAAVRNGLERAVLYGFTTCGPLRFYVEMMLTLGSYFDTDPQLLWVAEELSKPEISDELVRADRLFRRMNEYCDRVMGAENEIALAAIRKTAKANPQEFEHFHSDFETSIYQMISAGFPEKWQSIGEEGLASLLGKSRELSIKHGTNSEWHRAFFVILMVAFGHGVIDDPLYPWIATTLRDASHEKLDDRITRLQGKMRNYAERAFESKAHPKTKVEFEPWRTNDPTIRRQV